jgi:hypothetical protein
MSKMQEHIFDDVQGGTVCRKCRSIFSTMFREGRYVENARLRLWRRLEHIFDDELNYFEAIKKRDCGPVFCSE